MPESKSKRKRKGRSRRPPAVQTPPTKRRTRRWVPPAFFIAMGLGVVIIILNYVFADIWGFRNWVLFVGLGLMAVAFAIATRWY